MSVLRKALRDGYTIKDASWFRPNSELAPTLLNPNRTVGQTFLGAERLLLQNRGLWPLSNELTKEFLDAQNEIETILNSLSFSKYSFIEKGEAYYVEFVRNDETKLEFLFGPSDWDVEMIIHTAKDKFASKDLLNIPEINRWVTNNRYQQSDPRNVRNELLWFIELLKVSLPIIE